MLVRYALETELDAVGELTVAAYGDLVSDGYAAALRDARARARDAQVLVCIDEGRLVGTATFVEGPGPMHEIAAPDDRRLHHGGAGLVMSGAGARAGSWRRRATRR